MSITRTTDNHNATILKWSAYPGFQIQQFKDTTIEGTPYKLIFGSFPTYPLQIQSIVMDFTGSIIDHSCLDPTDSSYIYPLFYRMIVMLNVGNDVYFDTTFPYTPRWGNEWTGIKTFTLSRMLSYNQPTDSIVILLYPTSCSSNLPYLQAVEFIPSSSAPIPSSSPATFAPPSIAKTTNSFKKYWYIFLIFSIVILFLLMVIFYLIITQRTKVKVKN